MENGSHQVYYKNIVNESEKQIILTAKMAREITNATIINNIHKSVLPKVKEEAEKGLTSYSFRADTKIDYNVGVEYLRSLKYNVIVRQTCSDVVTITLRW